MQYEYTSHLYCTTPENPCLKKEGRSMHRVVGFSEDDLLDKESDMNAIVESKASRTEC
jgi:hypothetical protein